MRTDVIDWSGAEMSGAVAIGAYKMSGAVGAEMGYRGLAEIPQPTPQPSRLNSCHKISGV